MDYANNINEMVLVLEIIALDSYYYIFLYLLFSKKLVFTKVLVW